MPIFRLVLLCVLLLGPAFAGTEVVRGQSRVLVLTNEEKDKTIEIEKGFRVMVRHDLEEKDWRGRLDSVGLDFIVVKGRTIPLDQIAGINGVRPGNVAGMVAGSALIIGGVVWNALGQAFFFWGLSDGDPILLVGGPLDASLGAGTVAVGAIPFVRRKRRFYRGNGWVLSTREE